MPAERTRSELFALLSVKFPDTPINAIPPAALREFLGELLTSDWNRADDGVPAGGSGGTLPLYGGPGTHTDGPMHQLAATLLFNMGANNARPGPLKIVPTTAAMRALDPLTCCYGTECIVLAPAAGEATRYVLRYTDHAGAWNYVCLDGTFDQDPAKRGDAQWYPVGSPAVPAYTQLLPAYNATGPAGYAFTTGLEVVRAYAGGTAELLFTPLADGPLPAPSAPAGDANWRLVGVVSTTPAPVRPSVTHVYATLAARDAADPQTLCLDATCSISSLAEGDPDKYWVVQYTPHSSSTFYVYRDETFSGSMVDATWQRAPAAYDDTDLRASVYVRDSQGFTSYDSLPAALAAGTTDLVVNLNWGGYLLTADVSMTEGTLRGGGAIVSMENGVRASFLSASVNDVFFDGGGTVACLTPAAVRAPFFHSLFSAGTTLEVPAGKAALLEYCTLLGPVQVVGALILRPGTTVPAGFFSTFTLNPDGTYTTPDGGTVIDERGGAGGPTRNIYGLSDTEETRVKALFTSPTQPSAYDATYTPTNAPFGSVVMDFANGDRYELAPNKQDPDGNGNAKPYWIRL